MKKKFTWPKLRKYHLPFWQDPTFVFLLIAILVTLSILALFVFKEKPYFFEIILSLFVFFGIFLNFIILKISEKLADAELLKRRFLAVLLYQIKAPITAIKWVLTFLKREKKGEIEKKYYDEIDIAEKRISKLINNITIALSLEEGGLFFQKGQVSLKKLLERTIEKLKPFSEERNVKVQKNLEELPPLNQDSSKLSVVFENLLDNAIRHSRKKGGKVEVILKKEKNEACVEFKDNGIGIPQEETPFVFQMFFRASNVEEASEGVGLGLYISKKLIEILNGKISFETKKNFGTTFRVHLPLK